MILLAGGLFLIWKATKEIHHSINPAPEGDMFHGSMGAQAAEVTFSAAIVRTLLLEQVFSIDSIITAVGMTEHIPIMVIAVVVAVGAMLLAADPTGNTLREATGHHE